MSTTKVHQDRVPAKYREHMKDDELQRFNALNERASRQKQILKDTNADRNVIIRRAIRRMRRANGKN
jgi:hypothetical protein